MSSSSGTSRKETERTKLIQEKCQTLLTQMLRDEDNKYCVDCDAKGPRWASWNLGVFLCIRCAGIHRNLGVHISRVKSVNLDTWTPEQVISLQQMGNSRARAVYEAQLPDGFRRPQTDTALESFIRAKYEHKKYLAREWVPPSPPKVDWAKEIDEELEKQKRKKKAAQACTALGLSQSIMSGGGDKKSSAKSVPLPAPLPKPKPGQSGSSPKTQRISMGSSSGGGAISDHANTTNDLLGLSSPTKPIQNSLGGIGGAGAATAAQDLHNDSFSGFLSATPNSCNDHRETNAAINSQNCNSNNNQQQQQNSLAKEEEDFFNQGSLGGINEKDKSGKLTKDSILALYGTAPNANVAAAHNPQHMNFGQPQQQQQQMFPAASGGAFSGGMVAPGYMGGAAAGVIPQQHHHQFMTPPNSASMYNSPVMTAPTAFTASGMHMMGGGGGGAGGISMGGQQFGQQSIGGAGMLNIMPGGMGSGGIMATGQPTQSQTSQSAAAAANLNLMHTNQTLLSGMTMMTAAASPQQLQQQQHHHHQQQQMFGGLMMGSMNMQPMATAFQTPTAAAAAGASTANLNQQFGNLNIGNVWQ